MPTYRLDCESAGGATHQYVFSTTEPLPGDWRQHPRFGWPHLALGPDHPLVTAPLGNARHDTQVMDSVPDAATDRLGNPAPAHRSRPIATLLDFVQRLDAGGSTVVDVVLHQLPEPQEVLPWRTA